jgi:dolichol kinase
VQFRCCSSVLRLTLWKRTRLLITTLWTAFKFVMVPLGAKLATVFTPSEFAVVFALIWGSYIAADALSEIGGALYGKQKILVRGIGAVNRKSIGGTVGGFAGSLTLCLWVVRSHHLSPAWIVLEVIISISNTLLELFSPRGTDDFVMATANAVICLAFGMLMY